MVLFRLFQGTLYIGVSWNIVQRGLQIKGSKVVLAVPRSQRIHSPVEIKQQIRLGGDRGKGGG